MGPVALEPALLGDGVSVDRPVYERAALAVSDKVDELGLGAVSPFDLARAAIDASGLPERLAACVESRDSLAYAFDRAEREHIATRAVLRETQAELVEALDRATAAERRADALSEEIAAFKFDRRALLGLADRCRAETETLAEALPRVTRLGPRSLAAYARARR